jgi:ATP synthase subunit 6
MFMNVIYSPLEQFEVFFIYAKAPRVEYRLDSLFKRFNTAHEWITTAYFDGSLPWPMANAYCVNLWHNDSNFFTLFLNFVQDICVLLFSNIIFSNFTLFLIIILFFLIVFPLVSVQRDPFSTLFRWSNFWVRVISFVANLAKRQLGRSGQRLFPILYVVFTFICRANMVGMVPYTFTVTSHIFVTFTLSGIMFLNTIFLGVRYNGILFLRLLLPAGSPMRLAPLLVGVEFVSFVARVFSLAIRLFANMMSGHTLLKILAKFAWDMFKGGVFGIIGAFLPCFLVFFVTRLEVGIAVLQAYVFTLLVSIYFSEAKRGGH